MPRKTKKTSAPKLAALDITFSLALDADGSIAIAYSGTDPRTFATGDAIVLAIAKAYGFKVEEIFKGEARA
jgi:hypothetical protein